MHHGNVLVLILLTASVDWSEKKIIYVINLEHSSESSRNI